MRGSAVMHPSSAPPGGGHPTSISALQASLTAEPSLDSNDGLKSWLNMPFGLGVKGLVSLKTMLTANLTNYANELQLVTNNLFWPQINRMHADIRCASEIGFCFYLKMGGMIL